MIKQRTIYEHFNTYTKEEIDEILESLTEEEKNILKLKFGFDYMTPVGIAKVPLDKRSKFYRIINKIEKKLKGEFNKKRGPKLVSIYKTLGKYSKEEIDAVLNKLSDDDKSLIYLKYGNNLENPVSSNEMTPGEIRRFRYLLVLIKAELSGKKVNIKGKHKSTIYDFFKGYEKEKINELIETLNYKDKLLIKKRYGENLEQPILNRNWTDQESRYFYCNLIPKMKDRLNGIINQRGRQPKSFYARFSDYPKEEVDFVFSRLTDKEKYLIKLKYGENLDDKIDIKNSATRQNVGLIMRKIKRILSNKNRKIKTIYEHFTEYSKEEVNKVIAILPEYDQHIINLKYGNDLEQPITSFEWNRHYSNYFENCVVRKINRKLMNPNYKFRISKLNRNYVSSKQNDKILSSNQINYPTVDFITKEDYIKISEFIKADAFLLLTKYFTVDQSIALVLKLGYIDEKSFSNKVIADFLHISLDELEILLKKALISYDEILNGEDISKNSKQKVLK